MLEPHWVQFHDGAGNSFPMLVVRHGADEHVGGFVFVLDDEFVPDNQAGLTPGMNSRMHIGRGDVTKGASWSPMKEEE